MKHIDEVAKQNAELKKLQTLEEIDMAEVKDEIFCKIEKKENSSFEIEEHLSYEKHNFVSHYVESHAFSKPNELVTQTHGDELHSSETIELKKIQPPCDENSFSQNKIIAETLPSISVSYIPAPLVSNAKLEPLANELLP